MSGEDVESPRGAATLPTGGSCFVVGLALLAGAILGLIVGACAGFVIGLGWLDYVARPGGRELGLVVGFFFMPLGAILGAVVGGLLFARRAARRAATRTDWVLLIIAAILAVLAVPGLPMVRAAFRF